MAQRPIIWGFEPRPKGTFSFYFLLGIKLRVIDVHNNVVMKTILIAKFGIQSAPRKQLLNLL